MRDGGAARRAPGRILRGGRSSAPVRSCSDTSPRGRPRRSGWGTLLPRTRRLPWRGRARRGGPRGGRHDLVIGAAGPPRQPAAGGIQEAFAEPLGEGDVDVGGYGVERPSGVAKGGGAGLARGCVLLHAAARGVGEGAGEQFVQLLAEAAARHGLIGGHGFRIFLGGFYRRVFSRSMP